MFAQPELEAALWRHQIEARTLALDWGVALTGFEQDDGGVTATLAGRDGIETVRARFLVGCDGANSTVRELAGLEVEDLGFSSDWLVVDLRMPPRDWVPANGQICDPARPTSCVSGGPGRRRFEFMLMPGEDAAAFSSEENAWRLLSAWEVDPTGAQLERRAMYSFHARCATRWQSGRVFIAGDAAHQMPPFFGRGMVSGARDALNLAWKLDHVLRGAAPAGLLDSYQSERIAHVQFALRMSVELGRIVCETEPAAVAARDAHLLEKGPLPWDAMPPMPPEILGPGFFPGGSPGADPVAGRVGEQHPMRGPDGEIDLLDAVSFGEFLILVDMRRLSTEDAEQLRSGKRADLPAKVVEVVPDGASQPNRHTGVDVTGRYGALFDATDRAVIVYRPDFHGFGSAETLAGALELVAALDPFLTQELA